uniref:Uncharacterized protein n=1 Tax=Rhabditophanes sp. KR3021 TaxID=114890 RepID=A0AC35UD68_9BILA
MTNGAKPQGILDGFMTNQQKIEFLKEEIREQMLQIELLQNEREMFNQEIYKKSMNYKTIMPTDFTDYLQDKYERDTHQMRINTKAIIAAKNEKKFNLFSYLHVLDAVKSNCLLRLSVRKEDSVIVRARKRNIPLDLTK